MPLLGDRRQCKRIQASALLFLLTPLLNFLPCLCLALPLLPAFGLIRHVDHTGSGSLLSSRSREDGRIAGDRAAVATIKQLAEGPEASFLSLSVQRQSDEFLDGLVSMLAGQLPERADLLRPAAGIS